MYQLWMNGSAREEMESREGSASEGGIVEDVYGKGVRRREFA